MLVGLEQTKIIPLRGFQVGLQGSDTVQKTDECLWIVVARFISLLQESDHLALARRDGRCRRDANSDGQSAQQTQEGDRLHPGNPWPERNRLIRAR
ncbi:hypothetical protein N800_05055 [Lysobacter daejeonensis GH1-9]|uniref:Uncharacterized protein n=1 Tax=Lysobacter daejeonensis GH1-9 TaxID=1385517 RepID=A0A0A0EYQ1_9GAMM|nr:hypothetical protein N800_05055 [Lysobacter daejeonensis GH1-9]